MRRLIYVPMIHSEKVTPSTLATSGFSLNIDPELARRFWQIVTDAVANLDIPVERIFFEGFTQDVPQKTLAALLAETDEGLPEHKTVKELIKKGATLEQTEDRLLQVEISRTLKELGEGFQYFNRELDKMGDEVETITEEDVEVTRRYIQAIEEFEAINARRDEYVARRITDTLGDGETGILFMGASHDIISKLPGADIQVEPLDERLREFDEQFRELIKRGTPEGFIDFVIKGLERER